MLLFTKPIEVGWLCIIINKTEEIYKKKYINLHDQRNSAIDIVADTSSPLITEMDGKPISGEITTLLQLLSFKCPMPQ